jgi:hypothetical protein
LFGPIKVQSGDLISAGTGFWLLRSPTTYLLIASELHSTQICELVSLSATSRDTLAYDAVARGCSGRVIDTAAAAQHCNGSHGVVKTLRSAPPLLIRTSHISPLSGYKQCDAHQCRGQTLSSLTPSRTDASIISRPGRAVSYHYISRNEERRRNNLPFMLCTAKPLLLSCLYAEAHPEEQNTWGCFPRSRFKPRGVSRLKGTTLTYGSATPLLNCRAERTGKTAGPQDNFGP